MGKDTFPKWLAEEISSVKMKKLETLDLTGYVLDINKKDNKTLPWEIVIDKYLRKTNDSLFVLNNQNFPWININTIEDYKSAKLLKFN